MLISFWDAFIKISIANVRSNSIVDNGLILSPYHLSPILIKNLGAKTNRCRQGIKYRFKIVESQTNSAHSNAATQRSPKE